ncbi:MAG: 5-formyltetrahydrofolate cyclo-ligase [Arachnia sp.]
MRPADSKDALRRAIQTRRTELSAQHWAMADAARTQFLLALLGEIPATVALYASRQHEPGTSEAITRLHSAGWRILLPLLRRAPRWGLFRSWEQMKPGFGGICQPVLDVEDSIPLREADVVVVACLAVAADGTRLGTGGGWYDRALLHRRPGVPVWALSRAGELLRTLPAEPHDVAVNQVVTELGGHSCGATGLTRISAPWQSELS